jgi:hypothetical protein
MNEVVNVLCNLTQLQCEILFGEANRLKEWLNENGIEDKVISEIKFIFFLKLLMA